MFCECNDKRTLIDHFTRRHLHKSKPPRLNFSDENFDQVSDILSLGGHSFACLQSSLRRFGLQFHLDQPKCLGVRFIKFFADKATHLEEMCM
ncbi:hypothetical protein E2562_018199 [Oryza meyeriana var. granulata]|uniref:Uncharacterized protein n=1 Tax=Oryza meyeriana var. granulata TaxID=110450 RepID=A0A6G1C8G5_9ORYZ|nr:hypothetical protein E2562_018199 [Oryza meyeriana var. granulata]